MDTWSCKRSVLLVHAVASVALGAEERSFQEGEDIRALGDLSLEELLQVTITTSKKKETTPDAAGIVQVITAQQIQDYGANNLAEILDRATNFLMAGSLIFPVAPTLRGETNDTRILVLLDGRPFRDSVGGAQSLPLYTAYPIQNIERIEIVRGPGSVLYGTNAYVGVINIISREVTRTEGVVSVQGGSFGTTHANAAARGELRGLQLSAAAKFLNTDGWPWAYTDFLGQSDGTRARQRNIGVTASAKYKRLSLNTFWGHSNARSQGTQFQWPAVDSVFQRFFADLGYEQPLGKRWTLNLNLTGNVDRVQWPLNPAPAFFAGNSPYSLSLSRDVLAEASVAGEFGRGFRLLLGGVSNYQTGGATTGLPPPPGQGVDVPLSLVRPYDWFWWSAYGQLEYQPAAFVKLVAGGQVNKPNRVRAGVVPRLGAIFRFAQNWGAKLLYGQAFRSGYAAETIYDIPGLLIGNPQLRPERIGTTDAQLSYNGRKLMAAATYYHSLQTNLINLQIDFASQLSTYVNSGRRRFQGVELEAQYRPIDPLRFTASYAFQTNRDLTLGLNNVTLMPNHSLKVGGTYSWGPVSVGLFDTWYSRAYDTSLLNPLRLAANPPSRAVNLLSANVSLNVTRLARLERGWDLFVDLYATNLLDQAFRYPAYTDLTLNTFPGRAGRAVYGQVRLQY